MKRVDSVEQLISAGIVAEIELDGGVLGVSDQRYPSVSRVQAGRVHNEIVDEVQFALNVVGIQKVGLIQDDRKVDTLAAPCRNTTQIII